MYATMPHTKKAIEYNFGVFSDQKKKLFEYILYEIFIKHRTNIHRSFEYSINSDTLFLSYNFKMLKIRQFKSEANINTW